ncbi:hypothetical protein [Acinetobacter sp. ANC 4648]|uniref:hypothetical protein n=1 Tax=Acinetobacter sp. ANC 4648 TaxID=1977875 RepID=UPI000A3363B1|nr:hypothetical protein [Acinetobacter sp. ANC 4648]OTG81522.1 hypothetical protein B9T27_09555 [Acinetobacter sp. ANC 4648]
MKSNLAHEPPKPQGKVIQFQKKEPKMTESLERGFIAKSRLFHNEVEPFLTDAAKNVYSALMGYITGFNKASDHISTRQIQGGKLKGSNKLGSATVNNGIKELVWFGIITVLEVNYRIGNKYQINEVSLVEAFEKVDASKIKALRLQNKCASLTEALSLVNSSAFVSGVASAFVSEASIDIIYIYLPIDKTLSHFAPKNPLKANFYDFQDFKKTNPDAHIKIFILDQQKLESEQKAKAEAERKDKTRKLSYDEVIKLTSDKFAVLCDFFLWEQYVSSRSMTAKTKLTKNALNTIYKDFQKWGFEGSNQSLKTSITGNYQGLFEPKQQFQPKQTQASTRMSEIQELIAQEEQGNATYGF